MKKKKKNTGWGFPAGHCGRTAGLILPVCFSMSAWGAQRDSPVKSLIMAGDNGKCTHRILSCSAKVYGQYHPFFNRSILWVLFFLFIKLHIKNEINLNRPQHRGVTQVFRYEMHLEKKLIFQLHTCHDSKGPNQTPDWIDCFQLQPPLFGS